MQCLYLPVNERFEVIVKRACKMYPFTFKLFVQSLLLFFTIQIFSLFLFSLIHISVFYLCTVSG